MDTIYYKVTGTGFFKSTKLRDNMLLRIYYDIVLPIFMRSSRQLINKLVAS